jgi:hypothetical protein
VKICVAGEKLKIKTACSYAAAARVCSELAATSCGPLSNRREWIPLKLPLTSFFRSAAQRAVVHRL